MNRFNVASDGLLVSSAGLGILAVFFLAGYLAFDAQNGQQGIVAKIKVDVRALVVAEDFSSLTKIYLKLVRAILRFFLRVSLATFLSVCPLVVGYIGVEKLLTFDEPPTPNSVYVYGGDQFSNDFHAFIQRSDTTSHQNIIW